MRMNWSLFFFAGSLLLYFLGGLAQVGFFYAAIWKKTAQWLARAALTVHSLALVFRVAETGHLPLLNLFDAALVFTWVIMFNYVIAEALVETRFVGLLLFPFTFVFLVYAAALPRQTQLPGPMLENSLVAVHVLVAFLGYSALVVGSMAGFMYLIQERQLRTKVFNVLYHRLPSLEALDSWGYRLIALGHLLLTLTVALGSIWAQVAWGRYWGWDAKEAWSLLVWAVYGAYLLLRLVPRWSGRRPAVLSLVGLVTLLINFLVINRAFSQLHDF